MTDEEHTTRAMLLDCIYMPETQTYEPMKRSFGRVEDHRSYISRDCETLELITPNEWWIRYIRWNKLKEHGHADDTG